jgi:hypothetical protein
VLLTPVILHRARPPGRVVSEGWSLAARAADCGGFGGPAALAGIMIRLWRWLSPHRAPEARRTIHSGRRAPVRWPLAGERPRDEPGHVGLALEAAVTVAAASPSSHGAAQTPARIPVTKANAAYSATPPRSSTSSPLPGHARTAGTRGVVRPAGHATIRGPGGPCACPESTSAWARRRRQWPGHHYFGARPVIGACMASVTVSGRQPAHRTACARAACGFHAPLGCALALAQSRLSCA